MAGELTLVFTPQAPFTREAMTQTNIHEYVNAQHVYGTQQRPSYRFTFQMFPLNANQMDSLSAAHALHQGSRPFFWLAGDYSAMENYNIIGEGNGVTTRFYVPNRFITTTSFAVRTRNTATGVTSVWGGVSWGLEGEPGIVTMGTAVASGHDVEAKWGCRYRVNFAPDGIRVEQIAANYYQAELILIENWLP